MRIKSALHLARFAIAAGALLVSTCVHATTLMSTATGNIDSTATWSVVDTTGSNAYLNSETTNSALITSGVASSSFTPAAETVTEIGVKLASVATSPSGTLTVKLANSTSPGNRECSLTVNVADLTAVNGAPTAATADGGWIMLACSASPNGTDNYTITANTSVGSQVALFSASGTNWSRLLVTSATKSGGPAAGDKFLVFGKLTGAGTHSAFAVTIETTALVNYGNVANGLADPSIAVGQFGTLQFATTASTAFVSEFAGPMVIYNGGAFTIGTTGTPIPSTSNAVLTLNSSVEGDTGINVRNGGTLDVTGSSGGRSVVKTHLTAGVTGGVTTALTTQDVTNWLAGDSVIVAATQYVSGGDSSYKFSSGTLSGNASANTATLSSAVQNSHTATQLSYTSAQTGIPYALNMYADIILLNRNVKIQGSGTSTNGYIYFQANAIGALAWVEFNEISGSVAGQRGLEVDVGPLGSFSLTNFSSHDSHNSSMYLAPTNTNFGGTASSYLTIQHGSFYNNASVGSTYGMNFLTATTNPFHKIDDIAFIRTADQGFFSVALYIASQNGILTNISFSGCSQNGVPVPALQINANYSNISTIGGGVGNTWGPLTFYADVGYSWEEAPTQYGITGTINGIYMWHEQGHFFVTGQAGGGLVIDPFYQIGSQFGLYAAGTGGVNLTVRNGIIGYDASIGGQAAAVIDALNVQIAFENMELCANSALGGVTFVGCSVPIALMNDVSPGFGSNPSNAQVFLRNSSILSNTASSSYASQKGEEAYFGVAGFITQDVVAGSPVKHAAWVPAGFLNYDTTVTHTSGYSLRMTPKVQTFSGFISGTTLTTPTDPTTGQQLGDTLTSNGSGFIAGTNLLSGAGTSYQVSQSQTVCSSGSPCKFQSYNNAKGTLLREQSAPYGMGTKIAVANGVSTAQACVWLRPSINTDAAPPWGGSAVTYNGDAPRMIVRANPYMGVQIDTVIGTSSPTAGAWGQLCATLPTAPADGAFELVIDADQTFTSNPGGSVNVAEWSCTGCSNANGSQFWGNGTPMAAIAPPAAGGLLVNPGMGGGLQ